MSNEERAPMHLSYGEAPWLKGVQSFAGGRARAMRLAPHAPIRVRTGTDIAINIQLDSSSIIGLASQGRSVNYQGACGSVLLFGPGEEITVTLKGQARFLQVFISDEEFTRLAVEETGIVGGFDKLVHSQGIVDGATLSFVSRFLLAEAQLQDVARRALVNHLLQRNRFPPISVWTGGIPARKMAKVSRFVGENLVGVSIDDMALQANLSPFHFCRQFKVQTGITPWQFVTQRRIQSALTALSTSRLPLERVAVQAGFAHASHMNRIFRRHLGAGSSEVRRQLLI